MLGLMSKTREDHTTRNRPPTREAEGRLSLEATANSSEAGAPDRVDLRERVDQQLADDRGVVGEYDVGVGVAE